MAGPLMPFPSTRVIPDGWSDHHRPVSEDAMDGLCNITRPGVGTPTRNDTTGAETAPAATSVAAGEPCRVTSEFGTDRQVVVGEQTDQLRQLSVAVRADLDTVRVNDVVTLTDCPDDESLVGRPLTVLDVARGNVSFERVLVCSDEG